MTKSSTIRLELDPLEVREKLLGQDNAKPRLAVNSFQSAKTPDRNKSSLPSVYPLHRDGEGREKSRAEGGWASAVFIDDIGRRGNVLQVAVCHRLSHGKGKSRDGFVLWLWR
jgi:hypothetical protein